MKIKQYKKEKFGLSGKQQVLYNRGIELENQEEWLTIGKEGISDHSLLDNMPQATIMVKDIIEQNKTIMVIVDSDLDGFTSSALFINYLNALYPDFVKNNVTWIQHAGKQHGFQDLMESIILEKPDLIVSPDGGTNDIAEHVALVEEGMQILILDHHLQDAVGEPNQNICIVNPQMDNYPNKNLTGAGVVWQFCRAYDEISGKPPTADAFLDLCALGNCGDMADYINLEIRAITNLGFSNIQNPFFKAMTETNGYSIGKMNGINYYSMAFYVVPFVNAITRTGNAEEKEVVFSAMLTHKAQELVKSSKRGDFGEVLLYKEAVVVASRVKRRQTKLQDEAMKLLEGRIQERNLLDNAVIICLCEQGEIARSLAGLVANKLQAKYQKPTLVLTKYADFIQEEEEVTYIGSARNYGKSEIKDFKTLCEETNLTEFAAGHSGAFGIGIKDEDMLEFIAKTNQRYSAIDQTPVYWVDYIWGNGDIDTSKIFELAELNIFGQNIPESLVCLRDIAYDVSKVQLMGLDKGRPTLKINIDGVDIIKFKSSEEEYEKFCRPNQKLTVICKCGKNEWDGKVSPQLLCEEYQLLEEWVF